DGRGRLARNGRAVRLARARSSPRLDADDAHPLTSAAAAVQGRDDHPPARNRRQGRRRAGRSGRRLMAGERAENKSWGFAQISFIVLMLVLMAVFVTMGSWQVQRLGEKEALIATVEERFHEPPSDDFPAAQDWSSTTPEALDYRPFKLTGTYD